MISTLAAAAPLKDVQDALDLGQGNPVAEVLQAYAQVRSTRTADGKGLRKEGEVELHPRAGPSSLPRPVPELVQVFMSVLVDRTFESDGSVAGLAAWVKNACSNSSSDGCLSSALINDEHTASPPEALPLHRSCAAAGSVKPRVTKSSMVDKPRLAGQSAINAAAPAAAAASQAAATTPSAAEYEARELELLLVFLCKLRASFQQAGKSNSVLLHFYFHSHTQLHVLLTRCMRLASKHTGSDVYEQLMWLPELLGMRTGIPGEQQMHSTLEAEMAR